MAKRKAKEIVKPRSSSMLLAVILLLLIVIAGLVAYVSRLPSTPTEEAGVSGGIGSRFLQSIGLKEEPSPLPSPSPTSGKKVRPLSTGSHTYGVSGKFIGPNLLELTINPVDAKPNQNQTISLKAKDTSPITSIKAVIKLDNKENTLNLSLTSGTNIDGVWSATAPFPDDTLNNHYTITVIAVSDRGTSQTTASFR